MVGSKPAAEGFLLPVSEATQLLANSPYLGEVVKPYLSGDDIASSPTLSPSRYAIFFGDLSLEECEEFPEPLAIVRQRVRPQREASKNTEERLRDRWWQFGRPAINLYELAYDLRRLIALPETSKHGMFSFVPKGYVYANSLIVVASDSDFDYGLLNSSMHWWWWITYGSKMKVDPRYVPSSCFDTFPHPPRELSVAETASMVHSHRQAVVQERCEGLTTIYNRMHASSERSEDVVGLRRLHVELDYAVAVAYGWDDLPMDHDFYDTRQGVRYTLGPATRTELLDRLLELNHERAAAEAAAGLTRQRRGGGRRRRPAGGQTTLGVL